jgi:hypothetical protein
MLVSTQLGIVRHSNTVDAGGKGGSAQQRIAFNISDTRGCKVYCVSEDMIPEFWVVSAGFEAFLRGTCYRFGAGEVSSQAKEFLHVCENATKIHALM